MINYEDDLTPDVKHDTLLYFVHRNAYLEMTFEQLEKRPLWRYRENFIDVKVLRQKYGLMVGRLNTN